MINTIKVEYKEEDKKPYRIILTNDDAFVNIYLSQAEFKRLTYAMNNQFVQMERRSQE